jgi:hypothetical protein
MQGLRGVNLPMGAKLGDVSATTLAWMKVTGTNLKVDRLNG